MRRPLAGLRQEDRRAAGVARWRHPGVDASERQHRALDRRERIGDASATRSEGIGEGGDEQHRQEGADAEGVDALRAPVGRAAPKIAQACSHRALVRAPECGCERIGAERAFALDGERLVLQRALGLDPRDDLALRGQAKVPEAPEDERDDERKQRQRC